MHHDIFYHREELDKQFDVRTHCILSQDLKEGDGSKRFMAFNRSKELEKLHSALAADNHLYEIIYPNSIIKPYFDLEIETEEANHFKFGQLFINVVIEYISANYNINLEIEDFTVFDSCRVGKLSYHLLVQNKICFESMVHHKLFVADLFKHIMATQPSLIWGIKKGKTIMDKLPYNDFQNFRLPNQSKKGKHHILKNINEVPIDDCFVTLWNGAGNRTPLYCLNALPIVTDDDVSVTENDVVIKATVCDVSEHEKWIDLIMNVIKNESLNGVRLVSRAQWFQICGILKTNEFDRKVWLDWSKLSSKTDTALKQWNRLNSDYVMNIHGLNNVAKDINPIGYKKWLLGDKIMSILTPTLFSQTEYDIAKAFDEIYKGEYVCVDKNKKEFYCWNEEKKIWQFDVGGTPVRLALSKDFSQHYQDCYDVLGNKKADNDSEEFVKKKLGKMQEILIKLRRTNDKNNILTEVCDICKNTSFSSSLNKIEYMIPTNDGKVLNLKTLERLARTIADNFTFECNAKMIPFDESSPEFIKVEEYFDSLFCGNQETKACVLDILKSVFIGKPLRFIYMCIGDGLNGKSLLFKILSKIFGQFMDVISESVIIEQKGNKSALNTEIEKLDKCRVGYITEMREEDALNEKVIKQITGGDAINLRTLQTKDFTIMPTCNMFVLTNELPSFKGEAQASVKRIITIPFNNKFAFDIGFEEKMLLLSDHIFTYIMTKGTIRSEYNLSAEMITEKENYVNQNIDNTLQEFCKICLIDDAEGSIILNDIRIIFENYCLKNKLKNCLTQRKFTTKMKKLGFDIKESNGKTRLYGKLIVFEQEENEVPTIPLLK